MKFPILIIFIVVFISGALANERIRLESLKVITLHQGRLTNGRRSAPVPQLQCTGGSAGCSAFTPQVVQCRNMGSDGYDVQWECKTDMSNKYRFGRIDVNCEGYDYPNDPFVLRGSCGLRYTLDLAKKSKRDKKRGHSSLHYTSKGGSGMFGNLLVIAIVCVVIFFIYKTCLAPRGHPEQFERPPPYAPNDPPPYPAQDPPPYESGGAYGAPPPPGFRPEFTGKREDCNARYRGSAGTQQQQTEGGGPGFFTGAFGGAILGYLFGSRGNSDTYTQPYYSTGYESSSYCEPPRRGMYPDLSRRSSSSSSDGGTRTASGFGGTSRR